MTTSTTDSDDASGAAPEAAAPTGTAPVLHPRRRWPMVVAAVIGAALVIMPVAFDMFVKTPKGAVMLAEFRPFMTTQRLDGFQADIRQINAGVEEDKAGVTGYFESKGVTPSELDSRYPSLAGLDTQWPGIDSDMTNLLDKVQANLGNYQAIDALPSFRLFPWFFVIPGVLILGASLFALIRPRWWRAARWTIAVVGIGLVLAPAVFQMFQRAPDGGRMMTSFKTIETTPNVTRIQNYFATMASGQGDLRLGVVPALEQSGLSSVQVADTFPGVTVLDTNWIHILNDMTPMIGAMSDSVPDYQAIASLPPFPLFPWFFVLPGLLVFGAALLSRNQSTTPQHLPEGAV